MEEPLIIQYTMLLQKYGNPSASEVCKFRDQHIDDELFQRRAKTVDQIFGMKTITIQVTSQ